MVIYNSVGEIFNTEEGLKFWNDLVMKTRKEIEIALKDYKPTPKSTNRACYIYNQAGELISEFDTVRNCASYLNGNKTTVGNYLNKEWNYKGFLLSHDNLKNDVAFAMYKFNVEHGHVFLEGSTSKKIPIYSYNSEGKLIGVYESKNKWSKSNKRSPTMLKTLMLKNDRVIDNKLVSVNRYSEADARVIYKSKQK